MQLYNFYNFVSEDYNSNNGNCSKYDFHTIGVENTKLFSILVPDSIANNGYDYIEFFWNIKQSTKNIFFNEKYGTNVPLF